MSDGVFRCLAAMLTLQASVAAGIEAPNQDSSPDHIRVQQGSITAQALGASRRVALEVTSELVDLAPSSDEGAPMLLTWAFEPESGLVIWRYIRSNEFDPADRIAAEAIRARYYVGDGELVMVVLNDAPPTVNLQRSALRVGSAAEGRARAVADLESKALRMEGTSRGLLASVDPRRFLPRTFYHDGHSSFRWTEPKILGLRREAGGWILTLEGEPGYVAELTLDQNFLQTSARLIAEPPRVRIGEGPADRMTWIDLVDSDRLGGWTQQRTLSAAVVVFELPGGESYRGALYRTSTADRVTGKRIEWWRFEIGDPPAGWAEAIQRESRFYHTGDEVLEVRVLPDGSSVRITSSKELPQSELKGKVMEYLRERAMTLREQPVKFGVDVFPNQMVPGWSEKAGSKSEAADLQRVGDGWVLTVTGETGAVGRIELDRDFRAVAGELVHDPGWGE